MLEIRKAKYCSIINYISIVGLLYFLGAGIENFVWVKNISYVNL